MTDPGGDAGGADADTPYTLDNVCDRIVPVTCEIEKPCCGSDFDQAGCESHARAQCETNVAEARAGRETFHPERIAECIPKYRQIFASCTLTFDLLQKYARDIGGCEAFSGQLPEGSTCDRTGQCQPTSDPNSIMGCDNDTKKCKITKLLSEGASCTLTDGFPGLCDDGLYCDIDFSKPPLRGVCKKKTSLGVACDGNRKPFSLECGLGNYCPGETAICTTGKAGDLACSNDVECAAVSCQKADGGTSGSCAVQKRWVKLEECKGP